MSESALCIIASTCTSEFGAANGHHFPFDLIVPGSLPALSELFALSGRGSWRWRSRLPFATWGPFEFAMNRVELIIRHSFMSSLASIPAIAGSAKATQMSVMEVAERSAN